jgi:hypothetical protein
LVQSVEKLDDKIDALGRNFDRFSNIVERLERRLTSGGEFRSVQQPIPRPER